GRGGKGAVTIGAGAPGGHRAPLRPRGWAAALGLALTLAVGAPACSATTPASAPAPTAPEVPVRSMVTSVAPTTAAPTTVPASSAALATTTSAPPPPVLTTPPQPITIAFGGDVHGEPPIAGVLARGENPLASVAGTLAAADVAMVNLETAVGSIGTPADKEFTFRADPALLDRLVDAGVDVVSVANN